jgi:DNA-binding NtrC family response regulator
MNRKGKILIVDDEPGVLNVLADIVGVLGFSVIAVPDAESALSVVKGGENIALVITDLSLPGMNGSDLLAEIKRAMPAVPVIVLTAHGSVESFIQTQSRGMYEYINKPVQAAELRRIVLSAMGSGANGAGHSLAKA